MMFRNSLLLIAALVAAASARKHHDHVHHTDMKEKSFKHFPEASAYSGGKIKLEYYTSPGADQDLDYLHHLKATVIRLFGEAVEFTPHDVVLPGQYHNCRTEDNRPLEEFSGSCNFHCMQHGRYCDWSSFKPLATKAKHNHGLQGSTYVEESARRTCIWRKYGSGNAHNNLYRYFQYHDAMKGTGCDTDYSDSCIEQVFETVDFDKETIDNCMGDMDTTSDDHNYILDKVISDQVLPKALPAVYLNGREIADLEGKVRFAKNGSTDKHILNMVCDALPDDRPKPQVCEFCLNWCPSVTGGQFDINTCLWELDCGKNNADLNFERYMAAWKASHPGETFSSEGLKGASTLHLIATFMVVVLAAGLTALAVMAIRVWRTKMIIDRYVKEQQAMNKGEGGGVYGHRDPTFFPEDNELDLDLEPALQYSDHIQSSAGSNHPPSRANFLPQLT